MISNKSGSELTKQVMKVITNKGGKAINLIAAGKSGNADIIACYKGRYLELEIKGRGDTIKPSQTVKLNSAITAGGYACFVFKLADVYDLLHLVDIGAPCPRVIDTVKCITL